MKTTPLLLLAAVFGFALSRGAEAPANLFGNPSFELGRDGWTMDKAGRTEGGFAVDDQEAADGHSSALLTIDTVESWGMQFGQHFAAGAKGKTYTFAVVARSTQRPAEIGLEIERSAKPYDRAAGQTFKLTSEWQEIHVTFKVEKDFSEGWFAYLSCTQPKTQVRADLFRLYEGSYVPYKEATREEVAAVAVRVFDTGTPSASPLENDQFAKRNGWSAVPEDEVTRKFKGDGVLMNDRLALVLRRKASGAELYSLDHDGAVLRATLAPATGTGAGKLSTFKLVENNPAAGAFEVAFTAQDKKPLTLRYELKLGQPFVQTLARSGVANLRVQAPCRYLVMPDFFADDIVMDATELPVADAELPSDNFLLHLLPDHQAILMTVVKTSEEDVRVGLSGQGDQRTFDRSDLHYGKDGKIWAGVMTGQSIWHEQLIASTNAGQILRLDWKAPFPAQWRVDWRREENLTDSWEMLTERADGRFTKQGLFGGGDTIPADRKRWTTVLGEFKYPAWVDRDGQGFLQPLKTQALRFEGPALIYPLSRAPATALDAFTVLDLVRNTLGVGPCEYVLDVEGQQSQYKGRATCSVRDTLNPIYNQHQQKERKQEIEKVLEDLIIFIRHIRGRIESYVAFGHESLSYLAAQKQARPELADRIAELESLARTIDAKVAARREKIKTPDQTAEIVQEFRQTVLDDDGADAPAKCKHFTEAWVEIGGNQDELVGECRWAVKMVRQRAGLLMALDPRMAEISKEIRQRSQVVLRNAAAHEGARH